MNRLPLRWHRHTCLWSGAARTSSYASTRQRQAALPLSPASRRAFTLTELLAVLVIVILLAATFVPYAMSLRESANRAGCAKNLVEIYWALSQYAQQNGSAFPYPRTRFDPAMGNRWTAFTGPDAADPFSATGGVEANDVSASIWLLVRAGLVKPSSFVCPSSAGAADPLLDGRGNAVSATARGNFRGPPNLTYSVASPFSAVADYAWTDTQPSNFVLVADQAPSAASLTGGSIPTYDARPTRLASINSVNHHRAGQNVLYASGTVQFEGSPYCGVGRSKAKSADGREVEALDGDNIYTALAPSPLTNSSPRHENPGFAGTSVGPAYRYDTYLVPGAAFVAPTISKPTPPLIAAAAPESASRPASKPATTSSTTQAK